MRQVAITIVAGVVALGGFETARAAGGDATTERADRVQVAQGGRSCKAASTCEEAVVMWCGGYSRADADGDGIPCENVCRSLQQVEAIKKKIDC